MGLGTRDFIHHGRSNQKRELFSSSWLFYFRCRPFPVKHGIDGSWFWVSFYTQETKTLGFGRMGIYRYG
jgi:hypothetical protein